VRKEKRTYKDRREYLIKAVYARRKKVREMAVENKGGKCEKCGYDRCIDALEFHHLDPTQKDFNISSKGYTRSWERVKVELNKCMILCANCHREFHSRQGL
jgi:5-methylcytosine-specific restriction endonuclease McrA